MRIFLTTFLVLTLVSAARGQLLFLDNFDYPVGDSLRAHSWNITGTSTVNTVSVTSGSLSYSGYASSGIGNGVTLTNNGQDVHDTLSAPVTAGTVYASLLVRVTAAQLSDYFFHFTRTAAPTTDFFARTFIRLATNSSITFGIQKGAASVTNPTAWADSIYSLNTTYLLVVKYVFNTGSTTDDQVSLFVFTDPTLPASEPAPTVGPITSTVTDVTEIGLVALRQGTAANAPSLIVDGIRVGLSWNDAPLPVQLASFTGTSTSGGCVRLNWTTITEINNYGFSVQRSRDRIAITDVPNSFIPGHGTTNERHDYIFGECGVPSDTWFYRLKQIDLGGEQHFSEWIQVEVTGVTSVGDNTPREFELKQNYPNPFNPETKIQFSVENAGKTTLRVFNIIGQPVATLYDGIGLPGNLYSVKFDGANLPSGSYFYRLMSGNQSATKRLMLIK